MPTLDITLSKKSPNPVLFIRGKHTCLSDSFFINFLFEFNPSDHPAINIEGTLEPNSDFFTINDPDFSFSNITHKSKQQKLIVISFPNVESDENNQFFVNINIKNPDINEDENPNLKVRVSPVTITLLKKPESANNAFLTIILKEKPKDKDTI